MSNISALTKLTTGRSPILLVLAACCLSAGATILDLMRHGLPFSLDTVFAVQTTQPLHWIIDAFSLLIILLGTGFRRRTTQSTALARIGTQGAQSATTTKLMQSITELKKELTKQKRAEDTIRASEEFYRNLVENATDGIGTISLDGTITSVNRGLEVMLGKDRQEIIGRHYSTILSLSSLAVIEDRLRRFQSAEELPSLFEVELLYNNGTPVLVEASTCPIADKDGALIGLQGIYRDVTKRSAVLIPAPATRPGQPRPEPELAIRNSSAFSPTLPSAEPAPGNGVQFSGHFQEHPSETPSPSFSAVPTPSVTSHYPSSYSPLSRQNSEEQPASAPTFSLASSSDAPLTTSSEIRLANPDTQPMQTPHSAHTTEHVRSPLRPASLSLISDSPPASAQSTKVVPFRSFSPHEEDVSFSPSTSPPLSQQVLDLDEALNRVDGDRELLREMAAVFLDEYPSLVGTMRDALSHGNAQTLTYAVHTLKGSVGNFAASGAYDAVIRLERIGRQGNLEQAKFALVEVESELSRLAVRLTTLKMEAAA